LARKAIYKHATQVNVNTHPDDGSSPIGSNEWNAAPDNEGMLGFTPQTANSSTIIVASGVATITDSVSDNAYTHLEGFKKHIHKMVFHITIFLYRLRFLKMLPPAILNSS